MQGYRQDFLKGIVLPLPTFSTELSQEVLDVGKVFDYPNYSIIMNSAQVKRSAVIVCLNIDQSNLKNTTRSDAWKIDNRIGFSHQLDNAYYASNPWDKGHMAKRTSAAQGETARDAQYAANETFYYSNSCLQHENLNRDEWRGLEDWVFDLDLDTDGKITSFSGPFYGANDRTVRPSGRETALIPAGFFKIVCFINKNTNSLDVRAFIIYQDEEALSDKKGRSRYNNQHYQVTVSEIEALTGLRFDNRIYQANPLYYTGDHVTAEENVSHFPENIEIAKPADILAKGQTRQTVHDDICDIFICAALVDPVGTDSGHEWVSLINLGAIEIDLAGWQLADNSDRTIPLTSLIDNTLLQPGCSVILRKLSPLRLSNKGDIIKLYDQQGARIDWVNYTKEMVAKGKPVLFLSPRDTLNI